jgi:hypothetical protein
MTSNCIYGIIFARGLIALGIITRSEDEPGTLIGIITEAVSGVLVIIAFISQVKEANRCNLNSCGAAQDNDIEEGKAVLLRDNGINNDN